VWNKRRWRCWETACTAKTWTESSPHFDTQRIITRRAGIEVCRQVGKLVRPLSQVAGEFGVCWWTIINAVVEHGTALADDPDRVKCVRQLGVDETSFLAAKPESLHDLRDRHGRSRSSDRDRHGAGQRGC